MTWGITKDQTLPALQGKPLVVRSLFAEVANQSLLKSNDTESAIFAGLSAVRQYERCQLKEKSSLPKVPDHVRVFMDRLQNGNLQTLPEVIEPHKELQKSLGGTNPSPLPLDSLPALPSGSVRNIIGINFDKFNRLVFKFDTGEVITTNELNIQHSSTSYVTVNQGSTPSPSPSPNPSAMTIDGMTILIDGNSINL